MFGGPWEILIVLFIVLLLFGKRLPGLFNSLGRSVVEFKKGASEIDDGSDSGQTIDSSRASDSQHTSAS